MNENAPENVAKTLSENVRKNDLISTVVGPDLLEYLSNFNLFVRLTKIQSFSIILVISSGIT